MKKLILLSVTSFLVATAAYAEHAWGPYHWARTTSSFDLILWNSTTSDWDPYVPPAVSDWSSSTKVNLIPYPDSTDRKVRRQCKGGTGTVRICNLAYGQNGWLGLAGISIDSNGHITTGYTKLNDTYFSWSYYDTPVWRQSVACQELGHDLGLGHQDEDFNNQSLFTCMDYQDPPWPSTNAHDFEQLDTIYDHLDSYNSYDTGSSSVGGGGGGDDGGCNAPPGKGCNKARPGDNRDIGWGVSLGRRGQQEVFMRTDPDGTRHLTFVTWVVGY